MRTLLLVCVSAVLLSTTGVAQDGLTAEPQYVSPASGYIAREYSCFTTGYCITDFVPGDSGDNGLIACCEAGPEVLRAAIKEHLDACHPASITVQGQTGSLVPIKSNPTRYPWWPSETTESLRVQAQTLLHEVWMREKCDASEAALRTLVGR